VHDATYLPSELPARRGWGHSSYAEALRLAADAGVPRLLLFHHHPDRTDGALDQLATTAAAVGRAYKVEVEVAREGAAVPI
jgi:ribonuclease BN (tRNA processing enzyme)